MLCLKQPTDSQWAVDASRDVGALLVDHAHCEMKAAASALSLATRHPGDLELVRALTDLAREEIDHFQRVLSMLAARGTPLTPIAVDVYAAELGRVVRDLPRDPRFPPLADRLLVGAVIEARSCERFKLLAEATAGDKERAEEHALWSELLAVEARHYRTFVDLAARALTGGAAGDRGCVTERLNQLVELEGALVVAIAKRRAAAGGSRPTVHG